MKTKKRFPLFAIPALLLAMLACSLGSSGSPAVPVEQDETQQAPIVNTPPVTSAPAAGGCTNPYLPVIVGRVLPLRTFSASRTFNSWISFATSPVQPVWWLAPSPAPVSPWKYS